MNIIMLLLYTAVIMPFKISFMTDASTTWYVLDTSVDIMFLTDVVINLNLPYFDKDEQLVVR
jgi:hypothetical protein